MKILNGGFHPNMILLLLFKNFLLLNENFYSMLNSLFNDIFDGKGMRLEMLDIFPHSGYSK